MAISAMPAVGAVHRSPARTEPCCDAGEAANHQKHDPRSLRKPITHPPTARAPRSTADAVPIRAPSLDELETLVTCVAEGSLASAATILSICRPAVAKRVANLEALAGRPLLRRVGNGVRLTNAGAKLVAATPPIFHQREALLELLA